MGEVFSITNGNNVVDESSVEIREGGFVIIHDEHGEQVSLGEAHEVDATTIASHGHTLASCSSIMVTTDDLDVHKSALDSLIQEVGESSETDEAEDGKVDYEQLSGKAIAAISSALEALELATHKRLFEAKRLHKSKSRPNVIQTKTSEIKGLERRLNRTREIKAIFMPPLSTDFAEDSICPFDDLKSKLEAYQRVESEQPESASSPRVQRQYALDVAQAQLNLECAYQDLLKFLSIPENLESLQELKTSLNTFARKRRDYNKEYQHHIDSTRKKLSDSVVFDESGDILDARYRDAVYLKVYTSPDTGSEADHLLISHTGSLADTPLITDDTDICFVMANCLFADTLHCETTNHHSELQLIDHSLVSRLVDEVALRINHEDRLSPYEMAMFAQFEQQLKLASTLSGEKPFKLHYHLPTVGYELSGLILHSNGKFPAGGTVSIFAQYLEAVQMRSAAHRRIIEEICEQKGIPLSYIDIASPFDNLYDDEVPNFEAFIVKHVNPFSSSTEQEIIDDILQRLISNETNTDHQKAWSKAFPENITEARTILQELGTEEPESPVLINLKDINSMEALIHFANSMMIAIAKTTNPESCVIPIHSFDERPIVGGYNRNLAGTFGEIDALHVLPQVICNNHQGDRLFQISSVTARAQNDAIREAIIERYQPSPYLRGVFTKNSIEDVLQPSSELSVSIAVDDEASASYTASVTTAPGATLFESATVKTSGTGNNLTTCIPSPPQATFA